MGAKMDEMSDWQLSVLNQEGLGDWRIVRNASDGYCWLGSKTIQLPADVSDALFLHEVAHALTPDPEPYGEGMHYHGGMWADAYGRLVEKYMVRRMPKPS
jgi:hypothetical protein